MNTKVVDLNQAGTAEDLRRRAISMFGVTDDARECGYVFANGTMLDFSGRHYGGT